MLLFCTLIYALNNNQCDHSALNADTDVSNFIAYGILLTSGQSRVIESIMIHKSSCAHQSYCFILFAPSNKTEKIIYKYNACESSCCSTTYKWRMWIWKMLVHLYLIFTYCFPDVYKSVAQTVCTQSVKPCQLFLWYIVLVYVFFLQLLTHKILNCHTISETWHLTTKEIC